MTAQHSRPLRGPELTLDYLIYSTARLLARAYKQQFREHGLSQGQAVVLLLLESDDGLNQTEIARRNGIGKAAAGTLIAELETRGLVARERDVSDGRAFTVTLTPAGRKKLDAINDFGRVFGPSIREGISRAERRQTVDVLQRLRINLEAMVDADSP